MNIMTRSPASDDDAAPGPDLLISMLDEFGDLSRLMEIVYLAREPGAVDLLYGAAALPERTRAELLAFLTSARRSKQAVQARRAGKGELVLTAQERS